MQIIGQTKQKVRNADGSVEYRGAGDIPTDDGIKLPDAEISTPTTRGKESTDMSQLMSASFTARDKNDVESAIERERSSAAKSIKSGYAKSIDEVRQEGQQQRKALEGQMGTGRRFSSSAQAFLSYVGDQTNKQIAAYEVELEDALRKNDIDFAQQMNQRLATLRQEQQQQFENTLKVIEYQRELQAIEDEKNQPFITASREAAIADIFSQGVTAPGEILSIINFSEDGKQIGDVSLTEITDVIEQLDQSGGLASVVAANPVLFSRLTDSQLGEIIPDLAKLGFDFKAAMDLTTKKSLQKKVNEKVTNNNKNETGDQVPSFAEFIAKKEEELGRTIFNRENFRAEYDEMRSKMAQTMDTEPLDNLLPSNKRDLELANLDSSSPDVQRFYIGTPSGFKNLFTRGIAGGLFTGNESIAEIQEIYAEYEKQSSGTKSTSGTKREI